MPSVRAVTTGLMLSSQPTNKGGTGTNGTGFVSKPYLGKPQLSKLAPGADGSLNPDLEYWYCKDTSYLKDDCIKLNCWLAMELKKLDPNVAPNTHTSNPKLANYRLLCLWTRAGEQAKMVKNTTDMENVLSQ